MPAFRYRTATLLGPWRATAEEAVADAIRAKQARPDDEGEGWHWLVPGVIEEGEGQPVSATAGKRPAGTTTRREPQTS